jgi:glucokinase
MAKKDDHLYLGIDVGGTKILAALARRSGKILGRKRATTPRGTDPQETVDAIVGVIRELLKENGLSKRDVQAMGLAVPGVVDPEQGRVVVTPNMNLSGVKLVPQMQQTFRMPIALGNDVNLGTLGEYWLGSAALADSAVGIFIGTGIGGGIILDGRLVVGHRGAAAEIGHMLVRKNGPPCGCGSRGCLEALASRTAIERDLRDALGRGRSSILPELAGGDLSVIRSSVLRKALTENDALVKEVVTEAAQTLGDACLQIRHLLDPEVIVLGGGLIEACKFFILPIVQDAVASDPLPGITTGGKVVVSSLGDDAVVLGAVALVQQQEGGDPLGKARRKSLGRYPMVSDIRPNRITVGERTFEEDVYIRANGKIGVRSKIRAEDEPANVHQISAAELKAVCKDRPSILIIGTGHCRSVTLSDDAEQFLRRRGVTYELLPSADAAGAYNTIKGRKAALLHVTC